MAGFDLTRNYREAYGIHASSGILFNHESPRRGFEFVTRKITSGVAAYPVRHEHANSASATWMPSATGATPANTCEAMWLMLQQPEPDDYVVATGECHSVREFVDTGLLPCRPGLPQVRENRPELYRPAEVNLLRGDASKAQRDGYSDWSHRVRIRRELALAKWWTPSHARSLPCESSRHPLARVTLPEYREAFPDARMVA